MARERVQAMARIVEARRFQHPDGQTHDQAIVDSFDVFTGSDPWLLTLDVAPPGGHPYRVEGRFEMPNRLFGLRGMFSSSIGLAPGIVLPVWIDSSSPQRVEVDWKALAARPGSRKELQAAYEKKRATRSNEVAAATIRKDPKKFAKRRQIILEGATSIAEDVRAGMKSPAVLDEYLATNVNLGVITQEEAATFQASARPEG